MCVILLYCTSTLVIRLPFIFMYIVHVHVVLFYTQEKTIMRYIHVYTQYGQKQLVESVSNSHQESLFYIMPLLPPPSSLSHSTCTSSQSPSQTVTAVQISAGSRRPPQAARPLRLCWPRHRTRTHTQTYPDMKQSQMSQRRDDH